jgi:hypothetical protein
LVYWERFMADAESKLQQADEVVRKLLEYSQQEWKVVKRSSGVVVSCQSVAAYDEKVSVAQSYYSAHWWG